MARGARRLAIILALAAVACGGTEAVRSGGGDAAGGGQDAGSDRTLGVEGSTEAAAPPDASLLEGGPCAPSPPSVGAPCDTPPLQLCEYGPAFHVECDYVLRCDPAGGWTIEFDGGCPFTAQGCPPSLADIDAGGACMNGAGQSSCDYPGTNCTCALACAAGAAPSGFWTCFSDSGPGCPWPRPRAGTACTQEGIVCPYAPPCCEGSIMNCTGGYWQLQASGPCP